MFKNPRIFARVELLVYLLILTPRSVGILQLPERKLGKEADVSAKETYTKLAEIPMDPLYHFDSLTEPLANGNRSPRSENNKKFYVFFCDKQRLLRLVL